MGFKVFKKNKLLKKIFVACTKYSNGIFVFNELKENFKESDKILSLGCGTCLFDEQAILKGHNVLSVDIYDGSLSDLVTPVVYDGKKIPLEEKSSDVTLLLSVLHHVNHQNELLEEVKRVSKRIIIQEDLVSSKIRRKLYSVLDNLMNLNFSIQNNNYHSLDEWKDIFKKNGFNLVKVDTKKSYFFINQAIFVLEVA